MFGRGKKTENDARSAKASKSKGMRIRDWKGLLGDADRKSRILIFALLTLVSISMTFTQMGFIGIGSNGVYAGYVLGLLGPVSLAALLLGKGWGALHGLLSGLVLLAHAHFQPLSAGCWAEAACWMDCCICCCAPIWNSCCAFMPPAMEAMFMPMKPCIAPALLLAASCMA
jgi:hypothetical protein